MHVGVEKKLQGDCWGQLSTVYRPTPILDNESASHSVMSNSLRPHGLYSPWNSPGQSTGVGSLCLLQGNLPNPGIEPKSPSLQGDSLAAEPPGKPKNTGVGSLALHQRIFLTQELNQSLLHCRQILYQLRCQGSPNKGLVLIYLVNHTNINRYRKVTVTHAFHL